MIDVGVFLFLKCTTGYARIYIYETHGNDVAMCPSFFKLFHLHVRNIDVDVCTARIA